MKCKMCGGDLHPAEGATTCECEFCGTTQTIPKLDNDRRANLYDRANHFRRQNEYDKAAGIYEQILQEDRTDAEAYWSLVLCRYGIEYVEDPGTKKRVPTVNRTQMTSIYADEDYKSALEYADAGQKSIYEQEAAAIDSIQKGILDISKREKPFDVFICYKETDAQGKRTPDSVLANDLYHQLTREGFKVFFSRITLEDKLGQQYEPYIFAALNSAKVMVVLGTRPEYFNAAWVKNEWSRYLALIRSGANKTLVPAYKDMDPYDLPEEFSHLQAQDMSKLGFMQDLIYGIKKLTQSGKPEAQQPITAQQNVVPGSSNVNALLERAYMALEDGEWAKADDFCEKVLNLDARNFRAYVGKLMAERKVHKAEELAYQNQSLEQSGNYSKALRFADENQKATLEGYQKTVMERLEQQQLQNQFNALMVSLNQAQRVSEIQEIQSKFRRMTGFKDAAIGVKACEEKIENIYSTAYEAANQRMRKGEYKAAAAAFRALGNYRDSQSMARRCDELEEEKQARIATEAAEQRRLAAERAAREEAERKEKERVEAELRARNAEIARRKAEEQAAKKKKIGMIAGAAVILLVAAFFLFTKVIQPANTYQQAVSAMEKGDYDTAIATFSSLGAYRDCSDRIQQAKANQAFEKGEYDEVGNIYSTLPTAYQDHADDFVTMYNEAAALLEAGKYDEAHAAFIKIGKYSDSGTMATEALYRKAANLAGNGKRDEAFALYRSLNGYSDSADRISQLQADALFEAGAYADAWRIYGTLAEDYQTHKAEYESKYAAATEMLEKGSYDEASAAFSELGTYGDSENQVKECSYRKAKDLATNGQYDAAIALLDGLGDYSDSKKLSTKAKADQLYEAGDLAGAYDLYKSLEETYQTHTTDYKDAYAAAEKALSEGDYDRAYDAFAALGNYSDAKEKAVQCGKEKAEALFEAENYGEAAEMYAAIGDADQAKISTYRYAGQLAVRAEYRLAAEQYRTIMDYEDSREQHYQMGLQARINGKLADAYSILSADPEYRDAKEAIYQTGVSASSEELYEVSVPAFTLVGTYKDAAMKLTMDTYAWGGQLYEKGEYDKSREVFASMGEFSDAAERAKEAAYSAAVSAMSQKEYDDAAKRFTALGDYSDSGEKAQTARYASAEAKLEVGEFEDAKDRFTALGEYGDSEDKVKECDYRPAMNLFNAGKYAEAKEIFSALGNYSDSAYMAKECDYIPAKALYDAKEWLDAINAFKDGGLQGHRDTDTLINECRLQIGTAQMAAGYYESALTWLENAKDYKNCAEMAEECRRQIALANARTLEKSEDFEAAYTEYVNAGENEKSHEMAYQAGLQLISESDYENAISWFEKAGDYSDVKEQILSIGEYYYTTQQYDLAEAVYVKVPETGNAAQRLYELGQYYELMGNRERAAQAYKEAGSYEDAEEKAQEMIWQVAEALFSEEKFEEAKELYVTISGYDGVDGRIVACDNAIATAAREAKLASFKTLGSIVKFGHYEQDNNSDNGKEEIEWIVLDVQNGKSLLLSRYLLDAKPYNTDYTSVTWETCTLRSWLNGDFMNAAFTAEEQFAILTTKVDNSKTQGYSGFNTNSDKNTQDKIFLLSYHEAFEQYFSNYYSDRMGAATDYAIAQGAYTSNKYKKDGRATAWWWLRSGDYQDYAPSVYSDGSRNYGGVSRMSGCVRPAFWINLESDIF